MSSRGRKARLELRVDSGLAYEALISLGMVNGEVRLARYVDGVALRRRFRALPQAVRQAVASLDAGRALNWSDLIGVVPRARRPRGVPELVRLLAAMPAPELKRIMLGGHVHEYRRAIGAATFDQAVRGDPGAIAEFRKRAAHSPRDIPLGPLISFRPGVVKERVLMILRALPPAFYAPDPYTLRMLSASAATARAAGRRLPPDAVVERMTRGLVYQQEPHIHKVLLIPSVIHRPWSHVLDYEATKIFCYPVAPHLGAGMRQAELAALYRALGDETRLRILKRLRQGRATFRELGQDLGLARSTIHQHALILRTAGLIRLHLNSGPGLELNPDRPPLDRLLSDYLTM